MAVWNTTSIWTGYREIYAWESFGGMLISLDKLTFVYDLVGLKVPGIPWNPSKSAPLASFEAGTSIHLRDL